MAKCMLLSIVFLFAIHTHAQNKNLDSVELSMTNFPNLDSLNLLLAEKREDISKANLLGAMCWYYSFANPETGLTYGQRGLQLAQKLGYNWGVAYCTQNLAFNLWALGNYNNSLQLTLNALHQFEELKDNERVAYAHLILANIYRETGDYNRALIEAQRGAKIYESIPVSLRIPYAIIGSVYELENRLDLALVYVQNAHDLDLKTNKGKWGWPYILLGNIQAKMKHYNTAFAYYRKALALVIENHSSKDVVDIYNHFATIYNETGKIDSCIFYASEVLQKWSAVSYQKGVLAAARTLTEVYRAKNERDSTMKYLEFSVALNNEMFNQENVREIQNLAFNEQLRHDEIARERLTLRNQLKIYSLIAVGLIFLTIALLLWRNNQHRKKEYALLQKQKQETDTQKTIVEQTLTELKSTQAQLIQSEKMASLGALTAGIAHEIQNPLNFVNNFSEVNTEWIDEMQQELNTGNFDIAKLISNDIKENEQKINQHGKRADAIVKGMLQHSQTSTGQKEPIDINKLADEYLRLSFQGLRAKDKSFNVIMQTDFDKTIGKINIIPQDIGRVLLNLYNNAFYAVAEKKKQQTEGLPTGQAGYEPTILLSTKKLNNKVEIRVKDNGNGVPQKVVDKIFQPFFTTKPTGQGTGLGLSLSYDIIKAHGGDIKVETKEGEGVEFIVQLPFA